MRHVTLHVRRATPNDLPAVEAVARSTWMETYREIIPPDVVQWFLEGAYNQVRLSQRLAAAEALLVAEADGRVIGFAEYYRDGDADGLLSALYVLPEAQGSGAGSLLLTEGLALLEPVRQIWLEVEAGNEQARRWYERRGFQPMGEREERLGPYTARLIKMGIM